MIVRAVCVKQYIDMDSLCEYELGNISFNEIEHYEKGKEYSVVEKYYNKDYYRLISL
tara:strand:- start:811 stop:981 length:171 start_codon:yes stop_codon:yes gene_type:complete